MKTIAPAIAMIAAILLWPLDQNLVAQDRQAARLFPWQLGPGPVTQCGVIQVPGSYELVNDLPGAGSLLAGGEGGVADPGDCLVIVTNNVTIDGNNFTITGDGNGDGVRTDAGAIGGNPENIAVRNVSIVQFWQGVDLEGAFFSIVENVTALLNDNHGITIHSGQSNRVSNNNSIANGVAGIRVSLRSIVTNNLTNGNGGVGLFVDQGSLVSGNVAHFNAGNGVAVTCPALVKDNVALNNGVANLALTGAGCTTSDNVAP